MRKGQTSGILGAVVLALVIPLLIIIMFVVNVSMFNASEGAITLSVTDEVVHFHADNGTATSLGNNYIYEGDGLTWGNRSMVEGTNYTVDWDAGTVTVIDFQSNGTATTVSYSYFEDADRSTWDDIEGNTEDSYDLAGILPIAIVGIAILSMIIGAIAGFAYLRR